MSNVVKFPKAKRSMPAFDISLINTAKEAIPRNSTVRGMLAWLWCVVRLPVFLVMYWLRLPIIFLCNLISIPMLMAWLFAWYAFPDKTAMVWGFCFVSFTAFVIGWIYDFLLMALSPQEIMRTL